MEGTVFSKLHEIVKNREIIGERLAEDTWGRMSFETAHVEGEALIAGDFAHPADAVLSPKLTGWHKVFAASIEFNSGFSLYLRLDNEKQFSLLTSRWSKVVPSQWGGFDFVREVFWCCADLTDREIVLKKSPSDVTTLAWIRCVPMTEAEVAAYREMINPEGKRNLHVHYDNMFEYKYGPDSEENLLLGYKPLTRSHAKICSQETLIDLYDPMCAEIDSLTNTRLYRARELSPALLEAQDRIVRMRAEYLHEIGILLYAAPRMCVANTTPPYKPSHMRSFVAEHPEYYIKTRDGRATTVCSYAFPEVRRFVVESIKRTVARGYDGVSLIAHRGMHVAFEEPVLDEFAHRYGGLDARRVPMDDPRLKDLWCEYVTAFVRELRDELDRTMGRHVPINMITCHTPEASRRIGVDVEMLCKEGLIDHFCAETMDTYEKLDGCLAEDGLIDLEKYKQTLNERYIVRREISNDVENVKLGTPLFAAISEKYGVEFFAGMDPCHSRPDQFADRIKMQKSLGAKNISFFNYLEYTQSPAVMNAASLTGIDEVDPQYYMPNFYRILSLDGADISTYQPNWFC